MPKGTRDLNTYKPFMLPEDEDNVKKGLQMLLLGLYKEQEEAMMDKRIWIQMKIDEVERTAKRLKIAL